MTKKYSYLQAFYFPVKDDRRRKAIRRGLTSIKGIGFSVASAIEDHAPYTDIDDFVSRSGKQVTGKADYRKSGSWKGTLDILRTAGALRSLGIEP